MRKTSILSVLTMLLAATLSAEAGDTKAVKSPYLRFRDKDHVVLDKTADVLDLQKSFTIEIWFRVGLDSDK
jgi:hypothetical protein